MANPFKPHDRSKPGTRLPPPRPAIFIRTVPNVMQHFCCSAETAQRYIDLRDEGYGREQAALMAGLADPPEPPAAGVMASVAPSTAKLCNYCGVVVDSGMVCTHDGEFNHCPNKQIGEAIAGVAVGPGVQQVAHSLAVSVGIGQGLTQEQAEELATEALRTSGVTRLDGETPGQNHQGVDASGFGEGVGRG